MLALFSIASGPNCHCLPFLTDEYRGFFLIDPFSFESGSDRDFLKLPRIQNKNVPWLMNDVSVPFSNH
jgi:hypothetical protein